MQNLPKTPIAFRDALERLRTTTERHDAGLARDIEARLLALRESVTAEEVDAWMRQGRAAETDRIGFQRDYQNLFFDTVAGVWKAVFADAWTAQAGDLGLRLQTDHPTTAPRYPTGRQAQHLRRSGAKMLRCSTFPPWAGPAP